VGAPVSTHRPSRVCPRLHETAADSANTVAQMEVRRRENMCHDLES
jgi:hypothetical protein